MAQCEEDIVRNMADDVVCISDDDERDEDSSNSAYPGAQVGANVNAMGPRQAQNPAQNPAQNLNEHESAKDDVIYVPDDNDEESFIIGPIRKISMKIIFGCALKAPTEFPYGLLHEINAHMENNVKGVSKATVKCVWECVLEQLSIMRIAYSPHIDVCIRFSIYAPICLSIYIYLDCILPNGRTQINILSTHKYTNKS